MVIKVAKSCRIHTVPDHNFVKTSLYQSNLKPIWTLCSVSVSRSQQITHTTKLYIIHCTYFVLYKN